MVQRLSERTQRNRRAGGKLRKLRVIGGYAPFRMVIRGGIYGSTESAGKRRGSRLSSLLAVEIVSRCFAVPAWEDAGRKICNHVIRYEAGMWFFGLLLAVAGLSSFRTADIARPDRAATVARQLERSYEYIRKMYVDSVDMAPLVGRGDPQHGTATRSPYRIRLGCGDGRILEPLSG